MAFWSVLAITVSVPTLIGLYIAIVWRVTETTSSKNAGWGERMDDLTPKDQGKASSAPQLGSQEST